jgi:outer membrane protein assembly factor BamB
MSPRLWSVVALAALAGACCKKNGGGNTSNGGLEGVDGIPSATPNPLDFGTVDTGTITKLGLTLANPGTAPLLVQSAAIGGDTSFTIAPIPSQTLQPGASFTVPVTFAPQTDGQHAGTLTFTSNSSEDPSYKVPLTGIAFAYKVEVSPAELDFGEIQVKTTSPAQTIQVTNDASEQESITVGPISGANAADFQFTSSGTATTASNASFQVSVTYTPSTTGPEQATLPISACKGCAAVNVALTGTGIDTQIVLIDNDSGNAFQSFGSIPQGTTAVAHVIANAVALPSNAQTPLAATLLPCTGQPAGPCLASNGTNTNATNGFTVTPTDQNWNPSTTAWPATLTPGAQATSVAYFIVSYTPPAGATNENDVVDVDYQVVAAPPKTAQFPVSAGAAGSPCQQVVASPPAVAFGTVLSGSTATQVVTLTNNGPELCQLSNIGINPNDPFGEFALQGGTIAQLSLSPGQSQPLTVTFTPATGTPPLLRTADLSMTTDDTTVPTISVPLSGTLQNQAYASSAWPKWHHDNGNTGLSGADTSGDVGSLVWKVNIGAPSGPSGLTASYIHSPVIGLDPNTKDDIVYMLGYNNWKPPPKWGQPGSGNGLFWAIDGPSGSTIFSTPMTGPEASAQESTPTIVADGTIFLMTGGEQGTYPQFYHIGTDGSILWSGVQAIGGQVFSCPFTATPSATANCSTASTNPEVNDGFDTCPGFDSNGFLYLFDDDQPGCDTYSSAAGGAGGAPTLIWSATASQPVSGGKPAAHVESFSAALTDTSESVFSWGGYVLAFGPSTSGTAPPELWNVTTGNGAMQVGWTTLSTGGCENTSKGSPAISGDDAVVAFGGFTTSCGQAMGGIVGINLTTDNQDWGYQFPNAAPPPAPWVYTDYGHQEMMLAYSSPATLPDGSLAMGWLDGLYVFEPPAPNSSGQQLGQATIRAGFPVATGLILSSPAIGNDGTIFVGSTDGNFYAINGTTGAIKYKYNVGSPINSSPAIGSDGTVYFAADDGNLYALR